MIGTLNKFRKRNIQTNIYSFLLVIFVVAISVSLICGLFVNYFTLKGAVKNYYNKSSMPTVWVETDKILAEDEAFFDENFEYKKRLSLTENVVSGAKNFESTIFVYDGKLSKPYIIEGQKGDGCFVDLRLLKEYNLSVNYSKISFDYTFGGMTKTLTFKVIGTCSMAENFAGQTNDFVFIDENVFLKNLVNSFELDQDTTLSVIDYNEILIQTEVDDEKMLLIENHYQTSASTLNQIKKFEDLESFEKVELHLRQAKQVTYSFPILFVIVSVLVIISTISQFVLKEKYNIGLLKSIGISNKTIIKNYCGYGAFFCFVGAVLGCLLSPIIIPNLTFDVYDKIFNLPRDLVHLNFSWKLVVVSVLSSVLIGYFSAFFVCVGFIKKSPKECMIQGKKSNLKSRIKKNSKKFTSVFMAYRNMKINISRTIMSVVGISGCLCLTLVGFGIDEFYLKNHETIKLSLLNVFADIFKGFAFLLLLLVMTIFLVQLFKERIREMALLKLHGNSNFKIWFSMLFEIVFVCSIGFVISALLGQIAFNLFLGLFELPLGFAIGFLNYLKVFAILTMLIFVFSGAGLVRIYKLSIVDTIKNND